MMKLHTQWVKRSILTTGISLALGTASAAAQTQTATAAFGPSNPFFAPSTLPFQAPPFDKIKDSDYLPAIDAGMTQQIQEVEAIANNPAPPTFENTIVALERTGQLLTRVTLVFNCVTGANTNDALQKVQASEAPRLAAEQDAIYLNSKLFARIKEVYDRRASLHLDPESLRLVEYDYQQFVKAGANLSDADKAKLKKLNEEESTLENDFMEKLLAATKAAAYATTDKTALAGLSDADLAMAADAAAARKQPGWVISLQNTTQQPDFTELTNRDTRKSLFAASLNRTERGDANDTRAIIARLAQLRAEKAALLGYKNFAAWNLSDQMAKTPQAAVKFLDGLAPASVAHAENEGREIQSLIDAEHGGFTLAPWDWEYYSGKVRKAKYDLDESQIKPYFELNNVLQNGVFYAAHQLYGLTFKERHDIPVWHPDVRVFEVFDANGKPLALWYCDYFKRDNKNGGAWMSNLVNQSKLLGTLPVVCLERAEAPGGTGKSVMSDAALQARSETGDRRKAETTEIVIVGGGIRGMCGGDRACRRGPKGHPHRSPPPTIPDLFRAEKLAGDQLPLLEELGLLDDFKAASTPVAEFINSRGRHVVDVSHSLQLNMPYRDMIEVLRKRIPSQVTRSNGIASRTLSPARTGSA